jgi:hypothetical protein
MTKVNPFQVQNKMLLMSRKGLIIIVLVSVCVFIVLSIISLLTHLFIIADGYKVGFPFEFYYKFHLRGNDYYNHGWNRINLILNCFIALLLSLIIVIFYKKIKRDR